MCWQCLSRSFRPPFLRLGFLIMSVFRLRCPSLLVCNAIVLAVLPHAIFFPIDSVTNNIIQVNPRTAGRIFPQNHFRIAKRSRQIARNGLTYTHAPLFDNILMYIYMQHVLGAREGDIYYESLGKREDGRKKKPLQVELIENRRD